MNVATPVTSTLALVLAVAAAPAQDSVSKTGCLPGDGVAPWQDASDPGGSEQCDSYVVDLGAIATSWGNFFAIGPAIKSSKTAPQFFGSLISAQGMSRRQALGQPFSSASYAAWVAAPGFGINNDASINDPPPSVSATGLLGHRFAVATSEFSDLGGASYSGILSALVNVDPTNPTRLFVTRRVAAVNTCDELSDLSQFGFGGIEEDGFLTFRADSFGSPGTGTCGPLTLLQGNNVIRIDTAARNCAIANVISQEILLGGTAYDAGATSVILPLYGSSANAPNIVPASMTGDDAMYIGTDFNGLYLRGKDIATLTADQSHFDPATTSDQRGNVAYSVENYPFLGGTAGTCAILGRNSSSSTRVLNLWGINKSGGVTGKKGLVLPASVTDNSTGFTNPGGSQNEFTHYHSQTAFRGGSGQVALGRDQLGRLMVAAAVDHPGPTSASNISQYIAVARVNPTTGAAVWTMAGYNDGVGGGKPILDGPGGSPIGRQTDFQVMSGSSVPGMGVPMIDGAGNVWFLSAIEVFDPLGGPSDFGVGLLRAVYNPINFSYELELVLSTGTIVQGQNSGRNYQISFLEINDSNSIGSGTAFSGNISEKAHLSQCPQLFATSDPRTLGGLVLAAEITYDFNQNGQYVQCSGPGGDPLSPDQDYGVLLYLGAPQPAADLDDNGIADPAGKLWANNVSLSLSSGGSQQFTLCAGPEDAGRFWIFTGTSSGTAPGFFFGGFTIPINFDFYTLILINAGSTPFAATKIGTLDILGQGTAAWTIPPGFDPSLAGLNLDHAYGVFDASLALKDVSNPWPLALLP